MRHALPHFRANQVKIAGTERGANVKPAVDAKLPPELPLEPRHVHPRRLLNRMHTLDSHGGKLRRNGPEIPIAVQRHVRATPTHALRRNRFGRFNNTVPDSGAEEHGVVATPVVGNVDHVRTDIEAVFRVCRSPVSDFLEEFTELFGFRRHVFKRALKTE